MTVRTLLVSGLKRTRLIGLARRGRDFISLSARLRNRRMLRFYSAFVRPGDLAFDVGANVGNRTAIFLKLGARVVAVEPQETCVRELRHKFGECGAFTLVTEALSSSEGEGQLRISDASTVSSMATDWIDRVKGTRRFGDVDWRDVQKVRMTTLDSLIQTHGRPAFCKIDVEGYEAAVLKGLSQRIDALSFEFTPEFFDATVESLRHLSEIGYVQFNFSFGESMEFALDTWVGAGEILRCLRAVPPSAFGDVYAR